MSQSKKNAIFFYDKGYTVTSDGRILNPRGRELRGHSSCKDGRLHITTTRDKENVRCPVHALAAYQLFGMDALEEEIQIRHLNGNPLDNSASNLALGTSTDNHLDVPPTQRVEHALTGARVVRKLTYSQADQIRQAYKSGTKMLALAEQYGVSMATVSYVVNNKTYVTKE